jgi:hypothetical protein
MLYFAKFFHYVYKLKLGVVNYLFQLPEVVILKWDFVSQIGHVTHVAELRPGQLKIKK